LGLPAALVRRVQEGAETLEDEIIVRRSVIGSLMIVHSVEQSELATVASYAASMNDSKRIIEDIGLLGLPPPPSAKPCSTAQRAKATSELQSFSALVQGMASSAISFRRFCRILSQSRRLAISRLRRIDTTKSPNSLIFAALSLLSCLAPSPPLRQFHRLSPLSPPVLDSRVS
jgi:hypothetical protein